MHKPRTGVYIFVIEGEINVAGENLSRRDGIGIWAVSYTHLDVYKRQSIHFGERKILQFLPVNGH